MAEIYDYPKSAGADTYNVMFNDMSNEEGKKKHMEIVKLINAHVAGMQNSRHYAGITRVFDAIGGYAGEFRPEVVAWIKSQGDIATVEEDEDIHTK